VGEEATMADTKVKKKTAKKKVTAKKKTVAKKKTTAKKTEEQAAAAEGDTAEGETE